MGKSPEQLSHLAEVVNRIRTAGFLSLTPFLFSKTGAPFITLDNHHYVLTPFYEGTHPSFTHPVHLQKIAKLFGEFHRISGSLTPPETDLDPNYLEEYQKRISFLEELLIALTKTGVINRIDRTILLWGQHFVNQAKYCLTGLKKSPKLFNDRNLRGFCHNDPAPRNMIIRKDHWFLVDLELSGYNLFIREFAALTTRVLRANQWNYQTAQLLVKSYSGERPLTDRELSVLPYLLCFPQRFWRLCSQRFQEKVDWSEKHFQSRLWQLIAEEKERLPFLKILLPELAKISDPRLGEK